MKHAPTPAELAAHAACAEPCNCCTTWNVRLGFPCTCPGWVDAPPTPEPEPRYPGDDGHDCNLHR